MKSKEIDKKDTRDMIIKIVLVVIIILLLIHNCALIKKNGNQNNIAPNGNIDIIEIKCDDNKCKPTKEIESLSFAQKNVSILKGDSLKLIVEIKPSDLSSSKLTWKSSDPSIVTVDSNGKITGLKEGTVTITVTSANGKKATCTVTVTKESVSVNNINLNPSEATIKVGSTTQISAKVEPENATNRELVFTSSDPSIATVDANGVVKGIKAGTVTINVKTKDGKVVATSKITVEGVTPTSTPMQITSLSFAQENVSVKKGNTLGLVVEIKPTELSNSKLTWESSDPSIVTVDSNGNIKGIKEGTATITVTSSNGKTATCVVTVTTDTIPVESITLTPSSVTIGVSETYQISATVSPENATDRELVWTTSDSSVATVNDKGVVTGVHAGEVTITAKTKDGSVKATVTVTVDNDDGSDTFKVYDQEKPPVEWNGSDDLKIFSRSVYNVNGIIAPESSNTYQFVVKNSTEYNIKYDITFIETNLYNINMKYKLKKNDTYIVDHYVSYNELNLTNQALGVNGKDTYYLEWKWVSSSNDTSVGSNPAATYGLQIEVEAESTNG